MPNKNQKSEKRKRIKKNFIIQIKKTVMKPKFSLLFIIGLLLGIIFNNICAGMCLGMASSAIANLALNDYPDTR
jgi:uncharacterized membrane protein